jgi:hypothetical protein
VVCCVWGFSPDSTMSGLYRSADFVYARIVLPEDSAHAILKEVGRMGRAHLVDLTLRSSGIVTGTINERQQLYKKRIAQAVYLEKKLSSFKPLFDQFGLEQPCQFISHLEH